MCLFSRMFNGLHIKQKLYKYRIKFYIKNSKKIKGFQNPLEDYMFFFFFF
jgi:hypothetical protein